MIYVTIIVEGGDFVATFLVYGQYFHYGNTVPHSGSNIRINPVPTLATAVVNNMRGCNTSFHSVHTFYLVSVMGIM